MKYERIDIPDEVVPRAVVAAFQHTVDTYASETNKTAGAWRIFTDADLLWRPHPRSSSVEEIMKHQLLSERRFFGEFLGHSEPPAAEILPHQATIRALTARLVELAFARLAWLSRLEQADWLQATNFFGVRRERIWVFWRRVLHTAHHRAQLTVYLRLLTKTVPSIYGPTADVTWADADPTLTVEAAERRP